MPSDRLLLVEDEEHLGFTLQFNLQEESYHVDWASTLAEAQTLLPQGYDLILLDVMLPDGDGFTWCKTLRQQGALTPLLFLTAKGSSEDIVRGLEVGADDYITKPFDLGELLARVRAMLRRSRWQPDATPSDDETTVESLTFGPNHVDFRTQEVRARDKEVELTQLELRLLHFFATHPHKVISREALLKNVWEVHPTSYTRTVDNFLVRLRRVFEEDPTQPQHFLTVRGAGYKFVP